MGNEKYVQCNSGDCYFYNFFLNNTCNECLDKNPFNITTGTKDQIYSICMEKKLDNESVQFQLIERPNQAETIEATWTDC